MEDGCRGLLHKVVLGGFFLVAFLLGQGGRDAAYAHRVNLFAWVEGGKVHTESRFPGGRPVKGGRVLVYNAAGVKLLEGKTDEEGRFSFPAPPPTDLKIVLEAGMGHRTVWTLKAQELGEAAPHGPSSQQTTPSEPPAASHREAGGAPALGPEFRGLLEEVLDRKLEPLQRELAALRQQGPTFREIFGGIGYILGLLGVAAWAASRKKGR
jgi:nickel transport protein